MKVSNEGVLVPQKHMDTKKGMQSSQAGGTEASHKPTESSVVRISAAAMRAYEPDPENQLSDWRHAQESSSPTDLVVQDLVMRGAYA
jgi:hypothetical protein